MLTHYRLLMKFFSDHPKVVLLLFLVVGIIAAIGVLATIGLPDIYSVIAASKLDIILLAIILQIMSLLMLGVRLIVISRRFGALSFRHAFKISMTGMFVNSITPLARVGGEPVKALLLRKSFGGSRSSAIIAIDTITEVVSSVIIVAVIFLLYAGRLPAQLAIYFIIFLVAVLALTAVAWKILTDDRYLGRIIQWVARRMSKTGSEYTPVFHEAIRHLSKDKVTMTSAIGFSIAAKVFEFARLWLVFLAIGFFLDPSIVVILWAITLIIMLIPWLPGSLGLVEFGAVSALLLFSIPGSIATSGIFIDRLISFWFVLGFTFLITWVSGVRSISHLKGRDK